MCILNTQKFYFCREKHHRKGISLLKVLAVSETKYCNITIANGYITQHYRNAEL